MVVLGSYAAIEKVGKNLCNKKGEEGF